MPTPLQRRWPHSPGPLAATIALIALLASGCVPAGGGGGGGGDGGSSGSSGAGGPGGLPPNPPDPLCQAEDFGFTARLDLQTWRYDPVPFLETERISPEGVPVELRVGEVVCYRSDRWDRNEIWLYGPGDAEAWLVMESDHPVLPIRVVDGAGAVWQGPIVLPEGLDAPPPPPRGLRITARILRDAVAMRSALHGWLPEGVVFPPLELVFEEGVERACPACIEGGRVLISDEDFRGRGGDTAHLTSWEGFIEQKVARHVLLHLGAIDPPISGDLGEYEPAAEAWGQGAATFLVSAVNGRTSFVAPRRVETVIGREVAYDLQAFEWSPRTDGSVLDDPIAAPNIAKRLRSMVIARNEDPTVPVEVAVQAMLTTMAGYPEDNGAPGLDAVDFGDALACLELTPAQAEFGSIRFGYGGRCRLD